MTPSDSARPSTQLVGRSGYGSSEGAEFKTLRLHQEDVPGSTGETLQRGENVHHYQALGHAVGGGVPSLFDCSLAHTLPRLPNGSPPFSLSLFDGSAPNPVNKTMCIFRFFGAKA